MNPISSIIRQATRQSGEKLNILTGCTHEAYESGLATSNHVFYALRKVNQIKDWNCKYRKVPSNYILLPCTEEQGYIPNYVQFDLVLSQNKFSQFQTLAPIAKQLHLPLISLEHTLPPPGYSNEQAEIFNNMRGDINVFISKFSLGRWNWDNRGDTYVIHHGVDSDLFKPDDRIKKNEVVLQVVNDFINRDWCCGYQLWQKLTQNLPIKLVGDTPGLSVPASSTENLIKEYQSSQVYLNTSTVSPIPTSLLEAMACGMACISTSTCMIPEIIEDGVNGFISNDETILRTRIELLLSNSALVRKFGEKARQTIIEKFSLDRFVKEWNNVFYGVIDKPFLGV